MSNWFETVENIPQIAKEAVVDLTNNLTVVPNIHTGYSKEFKEVGETISIDKPVDFEVNDGADITSQIQDIKERTLRLTLDQRKNVAWAMSTKDRTLNVREGIRKYVTPAMEQLANYVDKDLLQYFALRTWNNTGSMGTVLPDDDEIWTARNKLSTLGVPPENRALILEPDSFGTVAKSLKNSFVKQVNASAQVKGYLADIVGFSTYESQNVYTLAASAAVQTAVTVNTTLAARATSISLAGLDAVVRIGDAFYITAASGAVHEVNPRGKNSNSAVQRFVATAATTGTGTKTVYIQPDIIMSDENSAQYGPQYQTVTQYPVSGDTVTFETSTTAGVQNLAFHRDAFAVAFAKLDVPMANEKAAYATHKGITIRIVTFYDGLLDKDIMRFDILYGRTILDGRKAVRIFS